jgi:hypothetical protein
VGEGHWGQWLVLGQSRSIYEEGTFSLSYFPSNILYGIQNERFGPSADHHNTAGQFNPAVHGFDGINGVSLAGFPTPPDSRVIGTTAQLKEYPFNLDMNSGSPLGIGMVKIRPWISRAE